MLFHRPSRCDSSNRLKDTWLLTAPSQRRLVPVFWKDLLEPQRIFKFRQKHKQSLLNQLASEFSDTLQLRTFPFEELTDCLLQSDVCSSLLLRHHRPSSPLSNSLCVCGGGLTRGKKYLQTNRKTLGHFRHLMVSVRLT